jgi:hypothetical protein
MLISICFLIFTIFISDAAQLPKLKREYVVKKDLISGVKAGQFSIYSDQAEKNLSYRIESYYSPMQKIALFTYPHKNLIGKLDASQLGMYYEARYEILDTRNMSNKWFIGQIKRSPKWFSDKYTITLAERTISMKDKFLSSTFRFFNEAGKLLASYKRSSFNMAGLIKYFLKIYSNEFPDSIYILAVAAHDHKRAKIYGHFNAMDSRE